MTPTGDNPRSRANLRHGRPWEWYQTNGGNGPMHDAHATGRVIMRALNLPARHRDIEMEDGWPLDAGVIADDPPWTHRHDGVCGVLTAAGHGTGVTLDHLIQARLTVLGEFHGDRERPKMSEPWWSW